MNPGSNSAYLLRSRGQAHFINLNFSRHQTVTTALFSQSLPHTHSRKAVRITHPKTMCSSERSATWNPSHVWKLNGTEAQILPSAPLAGNAQHDTGLEITARRVYRIILRIHCPWKALLEFRRMTIKNSSAACNIYDSIEQLSTARRIVGSLDWIHKLRQQHIAVEIKYSQPWGVEECREIGRTGLPPSLPLNHFLWYYYT